jgi:RNA polymerase subunit RPABC4/transcription elongation factor Spt4
MTNYSIAEEYTLPSLGKVYTQKIDPVVKIRSMTTEEEMKRLSYSDRQYKNLCEVIDDCIINEVGISSYDMCLADYQFLLHKLRVVTYGSEYKTVATCPYCGVETESTINLDDLIVVECDRDEITKLMDIELPKTKKKIHLTMQTPRMLDDTAVKNKELMKKSKGTASDATLVYTLCNLISTVDGQYLDPIAKEDFVRALPMMDTNYIMQHAKKLVESFGVATYVSETCSFCGLDYTSSFRFTSEFFGPSIDI